MILDKEHLKLMTDWYNSIDESDHEEYRNRVCGFTYYTQGRIEYRLFAYIVDLLKMNELPTILPDNQFKNTNSPMFYRGVRDINFNASLLADYDYHKGDGIYFWGIFVTNDKNSAHWYGDKRTANKPDATQDVVSLKMQDGTKSVFARSLLDIQSELHDFAEKKSLSPQELTEQSELFVSQENKIANDDEISINYKRLKFFLRYLLNNKNVELYYSIANSPSTIALLLGFDAIQTETKEFAILNRGKIIVSESEFNRITSMSKNYKGGVINFEEKQANEFLRE